VGPVAVFELPDAAVGLLPPPPDRFDRDLRRLPSFGIELSLPGRLGEQRESFSERIQLELLGGVIAGHGGTTRSPRPPNPRATARPIPALAPVMTTVLGPGVLSPDLALLTSLFSLSIARSYHPAHATRYCSA
jgi:hypothetical protein